MPPPVTVQVFHEHLSYVNMLGLLLCLLGAHLYAFIKLANTGVVCRPSAIVRHEPAHGHATPIKQKRSDWLWGGVRYTSKPL